MNNKFDYYYKNIHSCRLDIGFNKYYSLTRIFNLINSNTFERDIILSYIDNMVITLKILYRDFNRYISMSLCNGIQDILVSPEVLYKVTDYMSLDDSNSFKNAICANSNILRYDIESKFIASYNYAKELEDRVKIYKSMKNCNTEFINNCNKFGCNNNTISRFNNMIFKAIFGDNKSNIKSMTKLDTDYLYNHCDIIILNELISIYNQINFAIQYNNIPIGKVVRDVCNRTSLYNAINHINHMINNELDTQILGQKLSNIIY